MSLIDFEGFEGIESADLARRGWSLTSHIGGGVGVVNDGGLHGQGMRVSANNSGATMSASRPLPNLVEGFIGCSYKQSGASGGERTIYQLREGSTVHLTLTANDSGQLHVYRGAMDGGTLLVSSPVVSMPVGEWTYLEVHFIIDNSAGYVEVRVEETPVIAFTGDTRNGGTSGYIDTIRLTTIATGAAVLTWVADFDDFYFLDATGATMNDFLGPVRVDAILPTANSVAEFTPSAGSNYQNVDDGDAIDDDSTYNETAAADAEDLFALASLPDTSLAIFAVKVRSVARRTDAGPTPFMNRVKSGAEVVDGAEHNLGESYSEYADILELNPDGDVEWDDASITALIAGVATPA